MKIKSVGYILLTIFLMESNLIIFRLDPHVQVTSDDNNNVSDPVHQERH